MNVLDALVVFDEVGRKHRRYVFTKSDLRAFFPDEAEKSLEKSLSRLVKNKVLTRAVKGVYLYSRGSLNDGYTLEHIAKAMRQFEVNYISLESALSEHGLISQVMLDRITVMTTGRGGEYKTPFGVIEFTHTKRDEEALYSRFMHQEGRPLPIATRDAALSDLKRVGRNLNMVSEEESRGVKHEFQ